MQSRGVGPGGQSLVGASLLVVQETPSRKAADSYRRHLKMQDAARLLASEFLNIQQVRIRAGFNDDSHFSRDFKKIYGLTPGQYQRLHFKNGNGQEPRAKGQEQRAKRKKLNSF